MAKAIKNPNSATYKPPKAVRAPNSGTAFSGPGIAPPMVAAPTRPTQGPLPPGFGTAANVASRRPFDPTLESQRGANTRNLNTQEAGFDQDRDQTIRDFGLDDPTDPFSRARLLQQSYQRSVTGTTNSMAAAGQLYAGSTQNALNRNARNLAQSTDALRKQQNEVLGRIRDKRSAAQAGKEQSDIDADSASLDRAVQTPVDPATVPAPKKPPKKPRLTGRTRFGRQ